MVVDIYFIFISFRQFPWLRMFSHFVTLTWFTSQWRLSELIFETDTEKKQGRNRKVENRIFSKGLVSVSVVSKTQMAHPVTLKDLNFFAGVRLHLQLILWNHQIRNNTNTLNGEKVEHIFYVCQYFGDGDFQCTEWLMCR